MATELAAIEVENLRGFQRASLSLGRDVTLLVGPNNSGKTSVLTLLDWLLNRADEEVLVGGRSLTSDECALLVPARDTRNQARRLQLHVRITDGRTRRRFPCTGDITILRIGLRQNPRPHLRLNVGPPRRGERTGSDPAAVKLLRMLQSDVWLQFVPAARDARSTRFVATLQGALHTRLAERAVHETQGGAPGEYRRVKRGIEALAEISEQLANPLWSEMQDVLLPGLSRSGRFRLELTPRDLVEWLAGRLEFELVTGSHDPNSVAPIHVGSGLQSLLDLAVMRASATAREAHQRLLVIEEPEAFLHPSAQRALARRLVTTSGMQVVVSTHSTILVEESMAPSVVLVRDHRVYEPAAESIDRSDINSSLLTGAGAELAFARSALLVEGEGDRIFFDELRRRLAGIDSDGWTSLAFVAPVGSNSSFAPWIRLLRLYGDEAYRPIEWLVLTDGDSTRAIRRALNDAQMVVSTTTRNGMRQLETAIVSNDRQAAIQAARAINSSTRTSNERVYVLPVDLEWAAVGVCSPASASNLAVALGAPSQTGEELADWLGSKCLSLATSSGGRKAPWMRSRIAKQLPWSDVSDDVREVLRRWLLPCAPSQAALNRLFTAAREQL